MKRLIKRLFNQVLNNPLHVLHQLQPRQSTVSQNYNLRPRKHDKELGYQKKTTHLTDSNFISERELTFTCAICHRPSVCRLCVVCNVLAPYSDD